MRYSATIDVPDLGAGIAFYGALGWKELSRPLPIMAVLGAGEQRLLIMERAPGTVPAPGAAPRDYARHWTPVHLDFHVADAAALRDVAVAAGATCEAFHERPGRPPVAMMQDPFGNGFCLIGEP